MTTRAGKESKKRKEYLKELHDSYIEFKKELDILIKQYEDSEELKEENFSLIKEFIILKEYNDFKNFDDMSFEEIKIEFNKMHILHSRPRHEHRAYFKKIKPHLKDV